MLSKTLRYRHSEFEELKAKLINFPFAKMPQKIRPLEVPQECTAEFLCRNIVKEAIAYSSLKQRKPNVLVANYELLFKEGAPNVVEGQTIYTKYFLNTVESIKKTLR